MKRYLLLFILVITLVGSILAWQQWKHVATSPTQSQLISTEQLVSEELLKGLQAIDETLEVEVATEVSFRWKDEDGYTILVPATASLRAAQPDVATVEVLDVPKTYFAEELTYLDTTLTRQGFIKDELNSTVLTDSTTVLSDHLWAYQRGVNLCLVKVNPDYTSYGYGSQMAYLLTVSCNDKSALAMARAEQQPLLDALELQHTGGVVRTMGQVGEYFDIAYGFQRGGKSALLKKEVDGYKVIFNYQEPPYCADLEAANLPAEVVKELVIGGGGCYEADGSGYREPDNLNIPDLTEYKMYTNEEVGISFTYPDIFQRVDIGVVDSGALDRKSGKYFGGVLELESGLLISFGGVTADYSSPRGGSIKDTTGYGQRGGQYFVRFAWGEVPVVSAEMWDTGDTNAQALVMRDTDMGHVFSPDRIAVFLNIPNSEFQGIVFVPSSDNSEEIAILQEIIASITFSE